MFEGGTRAVSFVHGARWLAKAPYVNPTRLKNKVWIQTSLTLGKAKKTRHYTGKDEINILG